MLTKHYKLTTLPNDRCYLHIRGERSIGPISTAEAAKRIAKLHHR